MLFTTRIKLMYSQDSLVPETTGIVQLGILAMGWTTTLTMRVFKVLPMVPMVYQYRSRFYQWYHW